MKRALLLLLAACSHRAPIGSCGDDLGGAYEVDGARWMMIDNGKSLEAYPLFDDTHPPESGGATEVGPRVIDLRRTTVGADGAAKRRFMHGAQACTAMTPAHLVGCADDTLEIVVGDPPPCPPATNGPTHRERWKHE